MPATTPIIDTPDYQRGVVNAQALLAHVLGGTAAVTVGLPPNVETLVVLATVAGPLTGVVVQGVTTGTLYPGVKLPGQPGIGNRPAWYFDVSASADNQVTITFTPAPASDWYVISDSGVHLVADVSVARSLSGVQYVVPVAPSIVQGDHPVPELQAAGNTAAVSGVAFLAAPGAGSRYRVFYATLGLNTAGANGFMSDTAGSHFLFDTSAGVGAPTAGDYKPSGLPLGTNAGIECFTSAGTATVNVVFTIETV